jgi:hypothetical protein
LATCIVTIDEDIDMPSVSIDTGVMEKSTKSAVVPVAFRWSDVGSWGSLDEVASKDKAGNVMVGRVVDIDSRRSIFYGDRRVVATIGLTDMVVVDTPDATLICPKSRAQDVKKMVELLKHQGAPEHLEHVTVHRPWGSYTVLEEVRLQGQACDGESGGGCLWMLSERTLGRDCGAFYMTRGTKCLTFK